MAPSNAVTAREPEFVVARPPADVVDLEPGPRPPGLYYGEDLSGYVVVEHRPGRERPRDRAGRSTRATAASASPTSPAALAFALRFADLRLFLSGDINSDSRVMIVRDIRERAEKAAPFLRFDADPYPVILDGRVVWVIDAYTTTDRYPYSQAVVPEGLPSGSGLDTRFNYVRNSVKVVIDSYDGTMSFYAIDPADKLLQAWSKAFPGLITPGDQVDADYPGLRAHFRYPDDLFRVQTRIYASYHVQDARTFYTRGDQWSPARDPGSGRLVIDSSQSGVGSAGTQTVQTAGGQPLSLENSSNRRIDPFYALMQLPGSTKEEYVILQPLVPVSRDDGLQNLRARSWRRARIPTPTASSRRSRCRPRSPSRDRHRPRTTSSARRDIASQFSLLNIEGSTVVLGNLQLLPIKNSIVYAQPVYVRANDRTTSSSTFPQFRFVIVYYKGEAFMEGSGLRGRPPVPRVRRRAVLRERPAVDDARGPPTTTNPPTDTTPTTTPPSTAPPADATVSQLLALAQDSFTQADAVLRRDPPDFAEYARLVEQGRSYVARALEQSGGPPTTTASASTSSPTAATETSASAPTTETTAADVTTASSGTTTAPTAAGVDGVLARRLTATGRARPAIGDRPGIGRPGSAVVAASARAPGRPRPGARGGSPAARAGRPGPRCGRPGRPPSRAKGGSSACCVGSRPSAGRPPYPSPWGRSPSR